MDKVACEHDAPSILGGGFTISPAIDASLRDRIRSLLVSRNQQYPPKTPCPSPDYAYSPNDPNEDRLGYSPIHTETYRFKPGQAIAKLAQLKYNEPDMGAVRFDGPAGRIEDDDAEPYHRRPSQPAVNPERTSTNEWKWSRPVAGLDQRARGDLIGREISPSVSIDRAKSSASKRSTESRIPRYHLRTVPPAKDVNKVSRPQSHHVPSSHQSELDATRGDHSSRTSSASPVDLPDTADSGVLAIPIISDERKHKAIDALHEVSKHGHSERDLTARIPSRTSSIATLKARNPAEEPEYPASVPTAAALAQPVRRPTGENSESLVGEGTETTVLPIKNDSVEDAENLNLPATDETAESATPLDEQITEFSGQQLSDVLALLPPPLRQGTVKLVPQPSLTGKALADFDKSASAEKVPSVRSIQSNSLIQDAAANGPKSPLLSKSTGSPDEDKRGHGHGSNPSSSLPSTPMARISSRKASTLSPVSRAMSLISDISTRSGIQKPSLRSFARPKKTGSTPNLTARPHHHRLQRAIKDAERLRSRVPPAGRDYESLDKKDQSIRPGESNGTNGTLMLRRSEKDRESLSKVILDLETLLKEALTIAGHAASTENSETIPLASHPQPTGYSRSLSGESLGSATDTSSASGKLNEETNCRPSHPSDYCAKTVEIDGSDVEKHYHGRSKKNAQTVPSTKESPQIKQQGRRHENSKVPDASPVLLEHTVEPRRSNSLNANDWTIIRVPSRPSKLRLEVTQPLPAPQKPDSAQPPTKEQQVFLQRNHGASESLMTRDSIREYISIHERPPVQPRGSSMRLRGRAPKSEELELPDLQPSDDDSDCSHVPYVADFKTSSVQYHPVYRDAMAGDSTRPPRQGPHGIHPRQDTLISLREHEARTHGQNGNDEPPVQNTYSLEGRHHFSIREPRGFSLSRSHRRSPIARDWTKSRKRWTAAVACITTAYVGLVVGIYAGEVPAIQYAIADEHHYTILGNVLFFIGLAITTALFYPLPLLHGRKPYTLAALAILLPLQFPQALAVNSQRSPYVATYRVGLLLPRMLAGIIAGFANINFFTTLLDLFGASLQSGNPHQEIVNENDVRRHGGGMGVWLGIWTWCFVGSIGLGFLVGAEIISGLDVSWGYWILIIFNAGILVMNIISPEVRRSAYRRSMAEVRSGSQVSRRVARGEIKMHLESTGPKWWLEEVIAGHVLAIRMLKQPGFFVLSLYIGWIFGQVILIIVLLGALLSKYYRFHPQYVGLGVGIIPLGALLAIPFQKASLFSRSRHHAQRTDSMTFQKRVTWTSHLVRRVIFMVSLPFAGLAYTLASGGKPTRYTVPIIFAGLIGFLSNLAIAECNGIIMETYDTSDLQPGMTGRPRRILPEEVRKKRTNFSCFPRVTAGFAIAQTFAFCIAAGATAWGGVVERHLGAQTATAVMAGVLLILTLFLIAVLWRFKTVQVIPSERFGTNILSGPEDEWKPVIIGNPSGTTRRMSLLELGALSRWSEIRRRNKLFPEE